ncbi:MAG: undecaprenyl-diphosphate phosphatase [Deltaproteobacteria bacterium]|nr:MAG: undecaprenyl-diphosphate phosphatase [Deltaproteobacteria bacterium]
MSALEALWLGLVQGLTEFLPISSSGHLVMVETFLGIATPGVFFEVAVHAATMFAVLVLYRQKVAALGFGLLRGRPEAVRYVAKLVIATVPAVLLVLAAGEVVEALFHRPAVTGVSLLLTGAMLYSTRGSLPQAQLPEPSYADAFWIGCAQAFALVPGISRSGSTIAAALALGVHPLAAAEFSFLTGAVAIAGAASRELMRGKAITPELLDAAALASVFAFVSGMLAIALIVRLLRTQHFHRFAYYAWAVGAAFLVALAMRG